MVTTVYRPSKRLTPIPAPTRISQPATEEITVQCPHCKDIQTIEVADTDKSCRIVRGRQKFIVGADGIYHRGCGCRVNVMDRMPFSEVQG